MNRERAITEWLKALWQDEVILEGLNDGVDQCGSSAYFFDTDPDVNLATLQGRRAVIRSKTQLEDKEFDRIFPLQRWEENAPKGVQWAQLWKKLHDLWERDPRFQNWETAPLEGVQGTLGENSPLPKQQQATVDAVNAAEGTV